jgi:hypothetical protein
MAHVSPHSQKAYSSAAVHLPDLVDYRAPGRLLIYLMSDGMAALDR